MDFIIEVKGHISPDLCKRLISKYTKDQPFSRFPDWDAEYRELIEVTELQLHEYSRFLNSKLPRKFSYIECELPTYSIFKDAHLKGIQSSEKIIEDLETKFVFLWYLDDEGETDFLYRKVKAETGKLVIFPASWTFAYVHSPSYIVVAPALKQYKELHRF